MRWYLLCWLCIVYGKAVHRRSQYGLSQSKDCDGALAEASIEPAESQPGGYVEDLRRKKATLMEEFMQEIQENPGDPPVGYPATGVTSAPTTAAATTAVAPAATSAAPPETTPPASNDVDSAAGAAENRSEAASDEIPDTRSEEAQRASADLPEGRQVLAEMRWINKHLAGLGVQDSALMSRTDVKMGATTALVRREVARHSDSSHIVTVNYLQSIGYDSERAPATMRQMGEPSASNAVNDMVGLADPRTTQVNVSNGTLTTAAPSLVEAPALRLPVPRPPPPPPPARLLGPGAGRGGPGGASFLDLAHHRTQAGRSVILNGRATRLVEGDMIFSYTRSSSGNGTDNADQPPSYDWNLWPFAEVVYVKHPYLASCASQALQAAIWEIEKNTCIRFIEVSETNLNASKIHAPYTRTRGAEETITVNLLFVTSENFGCFAGVGYKKLNPEHNIVNVGAGCEYPGIVLHLLNHALGVAHEQARYDRDLFVNVMWRNMNSEQEYKEENEGDLKGEFRVLKETGSHWESTNHFLEYDYGSIMHFGRCEFSRSADKNSECAPTLTAIVEDGNTLMGNRHRMSEKDLTVLVTMYGCTETCADGIQNQGEEQTDCGGSKCPSCGVENNEVDNRCPLASAWNFRSFSWGSTIFVGLFFIFI